MSDQFKTKIEEIMGRDTFNDHGQHKHFSNKCSSCFKEKCLDCNGIGEVTTMLLDSDHHWAPTGSETCENCHGTGFEVDEEILAERYA